jgi:ferric-dicitrate binding protein FerR (iron transport regulator)
VNIRPNADEIDAEARRWVSKVADPYTTREELGALDAWLINSAHRQAFERHMTPIDVEVAQGLRDAGLKRRTHS